MADGARDTRAQQAAEREDQMRDRFGLLSGGEGRPGVDALLPLEDGREVPFELKSTDSRSVSTARDVGREHIRKWRNRHWLFGFYQRGSRNPSIAERYIYASPRQLEPWIAEQENYVLPDWEIVRNLPALSDTRVLRAVLGLKEPYTIADARKLLKQQKLEAGEHVTPEMRGLLDEAGLAEPRKMTTGVYEALMDLRAAFSPAALSALLLELASPVDEEAIVQTLGERDFYPVTDVIQLLRGARLASGVRVSDRVLTAIADRASGYTQERMMVLLRERARYLLDRGATRNNPHISASRLIRLVPERQMIFPNEGRFAQRLEALVHDELSLRTDQGDAASP